MNLDLQRKRMVSEQLVSRGIRDPRVLQAFLSIPRHLFVPKELEMESYSDRPLPIGSGQTISQPYIQALMIQDLGIGPEDRILEIGTGSGYQTAILSSLAKQVYSIERIPTLYETASRKLAPFGFPGLHLRCGDGSVGWPEHAPFQEIIVAAASEEVPPLLLEQLGKNGRLAIPIGSAVDQILTVIERQPNGFEGRSICHCVFVPLVRKEAS